jgi:hypothetical protein
MNPVAVIRALTRSLGSISRDARPLTKFWSPALRSFQGLHPLQIQDDALGHDRVRQRRLVEIDAHRRAGRQRGVLEADTTNRVDGGAVVRDVGVEPGHHLEQLCGVADTELVQPVAGGCLNRHPDLVDVLLPFLRRHDDFLDHRTARRRVLRPHRRSHGDEREREARARASIHERRAETRTLICAGHRCSPCPREWGLPHSIGAASPE